MRRRDDSTSAGAYHDCSRPSARPHQVHGHQASLHRAAGASRSKAERIGKHVERPDAAQIRPAAFLAATSATTTLMRGRDGRAQRARTTISRRERTRIIAAGRRSGRSKPRIKKLTGRPRLTLSVRHDRCEPGVAVRRGSRATNPLHRSRRASWRSSSRPTATTMPVLNRLHADRSRAMPSPGLSPASSDAAAESSEWNLSRAHSAGRRWRRWLTRRTVERVPAGLEAVFQPRTDRRTLLNANVVSPIRNQHREQSCTRGAVSRSVASLLALVGRDDRDDDAQRELRDGVRRQRRAGAGVDRV